MKIYFEKIGVVMNRTKNSKKSVDSNSHNDYLIWSDSKTLNNIGKLTSLFCENINIIFKKNKIHKKLEQSNRFQLKNPSKQLKKIRIFDDDNRNFGNLKNKKILNKFPRMAIVARKTRKIEIGKSSSKSKSDKTGELIVGKCLFGKKKFFFSTILKIQNCEKMVNLMIKKLDGTIFGEENSFKF